MHGSKTMATTTNGKALFPVGFLVATRGVIEAIDPDDVLQALIRHVQGDWGNVDEEDWMANDAALKTNSRLLSSYLDRRGRKFWLITE
jgi:hypothetical protein